MQRSKFDIGGADAGAGGMSISTAARSARTSSSEEESTDEEERLLTNRCIGWHRATKNIHRPRQ